MIIIFALLVVCSHLWQENRTHAVLNVVDSDTIIIHPAATDSQRVGQISVSVPKKPKSVTKVGNSVQNDTLNVQNEASADEIIIKDAGGDSLVLEIPITQKVYEDSTYTAWVSGYRAQLDSIRVRERTVFMQNQPIDTKKRKISFGITGGVGVVGLNGNTGPGWFVGFGVTVPL